MQSVARFGVFFDSIGRGACKPAQNDHAASKAPSTSDCPMSSSFSTIRSGQHHVLRSVAIRQDCLILVLDGEKRLHTPQGVHSIAAGQALVITRGSHVDLENIPPKNGTYLAKVLSFSEASVTRFTQSDTGTPSRQRIPVFQKVPFRMPLAECFNHACKALEQREQHSEKIQEHRVQEVLLALSGEGIVFVPHVQLSWADRVRHLVAQRPSENWDCEHVARAFHLSPASLQRRLAEEKHSLAACVRESRMEAAMGLLQSTNKPIYDIAQTCGYRSVSKFSTAFRQRFGCLPSKLR